MEWYDWRNVRESLLTFGRAIQGVSPYTVVIEPDEAKCPTGYCNFTKRRIAANPKLFPDRTPREQYSLTRALLVHEAGHRRFTAPGNTSGVVHLVSNLLEDERIERLMSDAFAGLRHLVLLLSTAMYADAEPLDPATDSPGQVLGAILQARWAERVEKPLKGSLSNHIVFFSTCSAVLNMAYYVRAGANVLVSVPMAVFFPAAIIILSYLRGVRDVLDERRGRRLGGRLAVQVGTAIVPEMLPPNKPLEATTAGRNEQRLLAHRLRGEGRTLREISATTGIPRSTVGAWLRAVTPDSREGRTGNDTTNQDSAR